MTQNVGGLDRILRIIVGLGLICPGLRRAANAMGLDRRYPAVTALVGFCPAYRLVGLNTCSRA